MGAIMYLLFGLIEFALIFRFVFLLFGANATAPFVGWIYTVTNPLVAPFAGIFGSNHITNGTVMAGTFDTAALIAMVVYGLLGTILLRVLNGRLPR